MPLQPRVDHHASQGQVARHATLREGVAATPQPADRNRLWLRNPLHHRGRSAPVWQALDKIASHTSTGIRQARSPEVATVTHQCSSTLGPSQYRDVDLGSADVLNLEITAAAGATLTTRQAH